NIMQAVSKINEVFKHKLKITQVVPTLYDARSKICKEALKQLRTDFTSLVSAPIRVDTKLKEAPKAQQTIFEYNKSSRGAKDYKSLEKLMLNAKSEDDDMPVLSANMMNAKASMKS